MPIETVGRTAPTGAERGGPGRAPSSGFSLPGQPAGAPAAAAPAAEVGLSGMLALQEQQGGAVQDREARRRGQDLLAELAALQNALLAEGEDAAPAALQRLAGLSRGVPLAADPALRQAVAAIVLRSRVELARYDHDNSKNTSRLTR